MKPRVVAIIPARLGSRRFSGKVLHAYRGKPLLYYLWKELRKSREIDHLAIATDAPEIAQVAREFGAEIVMTSKRHRSGSDRVAQAACETGGELIINVQGDNIGLKAGVLDRAICKMRSDRSIKFATLARRIKTDAELFDPGVVKVLTAADGRALWFSRFPLPYLQHAEDGSRAGQYKFLAHIGVYLFRRKALVAFADWKASPLEKAESLEQLRILENGGRIEVFVTTSKAISIDTPGDLQKISGLCI